MSRPLIILLACIALSPDALSEPVDVRLWRHETDPVELAQSLDAIERFNAQQDRWRMAVETLPGLTYTSAITASALAGQLPCVMTLDQPVVPNFAWSGHLRRVDDLLQPETLAALSEGAKGTYKGQVYSVGQFDAALVLFAKRSDLERYDIRIATMESPYTANEFLEILRKIKRESPRVFPLDLNSRSDGEWLSYAFSPWVQSAGGDLIDRDTYLSADGHINGPAAIKVAEWYQVLFQERLTEQKVVDNQSLIQGRSVFHYSGSWEVARYDRQFGDDLVIMPPPDFGIGPRIGAGSWHWGVSATCEHTEAAAEFLEYLLSPDEIAAVSDARALIPTTEAGAAISENYYPGSQFRVMYEFVRTYAVKRPETPGYPKISAAYEKAMLDIKYGKDVRDALDVAADAIDYDVKRNLGYGFWK